MKKSVSIFVMLAGLGVVLAACASPDTSAGRFKVGKPYRVGWHTYYPEETYSFTETGLASWYGPGFDGKKTASGERFDQNALTAAHKTLQLPSLVRVTNLENGKSIVVRVTDRGPFHSTRVIDLSKRAAELLGFRMKGTAKVKLQVLEPESRALAEAAKRRMDTRGAEIAVNNTGRLAEPFASFYAPEYKSVPAPVESVMTASGPVPEAREEIAWNAMPVTPSPVISDASASPQIPVGDSYPGIPVATLEPGDFTPRPATAPVEARVLPVHASTIYVQAGSFANLANAQKSQREMAGLGPSRIVSAGMGGKTYYRVRIGPIETVDKADALVNTLGRTGREATIVVSEN